MDMFNDFNTKKTKMKRLIITIFMVVAGLATVVAQTTHDIKGVVTDKNNEPIVGALVTVENTNISTITDVDGKFLLQGRHLTPKGEQSPYLLLVTHPSSPNPSHVPIFQDFSWERSQCELIIRPRNLVFRYIYHYPIKISG